MGATIGVTPVLSQRVADWVQSEGLPVEVVADGDGAVQVVQSEGRERSDLATLRAGGWMTCADARALGAKLDVPVLSVGKLLDVLDIRVRNCELGCF